MRKMKDSGIEWIGEIPEGWGFKKLGRISEIITDGTHQTPNYIDEGFPFISIKDISSGKIDFSGVKYISESQHKELYSHAPVKKGDILFTRIGTLGVFVEVDTDIVFDFFVSVGMIRLKKNIINQHYLIHYLNSPAVGNFIQSIKAGFGTAAPKYNLTDVKRTWILFPPLETQKQIADFLDAKTEKIDSLKRDIQKQIETLEQYKKSVITETVTKGLNPNTKMKNSGSKWLPSFPAHWEMKKLKYNLSAHEVKGYAEKEVLSLYRELGIVPKNSRDDNHNVTSEDTSKYKYVRVGDFVINKMKAWQGSVAVSDFEGIVSPAYYIYEFTNDSYDKKYFHHLMRNKILADEFRRISGGIREGQWDLDREQFENMYLPVPPKAEQIEIVKFIESKYGNIEKSIDLKKQQLEKLEEYKKSLIFEYVTGKREV